MDITQAPSGINVVVETDKAIYIGRLANQRGTQVALRDAAAVFQVAGGQNPEDYIRKTARFGVIVQHKDLVFEASGIRRVRKLGEVPKA